MARATSNQDALVSVVEIEPTNSIAYTETSQIEPLELVLEPVYEQYTATAYCKENYHHICNDGNPSKTATGTTPTVGRTIAVDPETIPYGTQIEVNGHIYTAEDTGSAIKGERIDILFATHKEALEFGKQTVNVRVVE